MNIIPLKWLMTIFMVLVVTAIVMWLSYSTDNISQHLNLIAYDSRKSNFARSFLFSANRKLTIYIHGIDDLISNSIITFGVWEKQWLLQISDFIIANNRPQLIDFGCNIGVYTLTAAALGCHVVAIDANRANIDLLQQSIISNGFQDRVFLFWNVLSDKRERYKMIEIKENIGGQYLVHTNSSESTMTGIYTDDIIEYVVKEKSVIMKIDIQGFEIKALTKAEKLFETRNVIAVLIEWILIKEREEIFLLIAFFLKRSFKPYADFHSRIPMKLSKYRKWPDEIVWKKSFK